MGYGTPCETNYGGNGVNDRYDVGYRDGKKETKSLQQKLDTTEKENEELKEEAENYKCAATAEAEIATEMLEENEKLNNANDFNVQTLDELHEKYIEAEKEIEKYKETVSLMSVTQQKLRVQLADSYKEVASLKEGINKQYADFNAKAKHFNSKLTEAEKVIAELKDAFKKYDEALDCPNCPNQGWYEITVTGSAMDHAPDCDGSCRNCPIQVPVQELEQEQCQFCYAEENSKFNVRTEALANAEKVIKGEKG